MMTRKRRYDNEAASNDKAKVLAAIKNDIGSFGDASDELKRNRAFIVEVLQQGNHDDIGLAVLRHVPRDAVSILGDREIVEMAVRRSNGGMALQYAVDELCGDRELVRLALSVHGQGKCWSVYSLESARSYCSAFALASAELRADRDLALEAVQQSGNALEYASEALRGDREVVMAAATNECQRWAYPCMMYASHSMRSDREVMMTAVQVRGDAFQYASRDLRADRELLLLAVKRAWPDLLEFASEEIRGDREFVLLAFKTWEDLRYNCGEDGRSLHSLSLSLRNDKDIVMAAVSACGYAIQCASKELQGDRDVVWAALRNNESFGTSSILEHVSDDLKNDREIIMYAVQIDGECLLMAPPKLQLDPAIVAAAVACSSDESSNQLGNDFPGSKMETLYAKRAVWFHKELEARGDCLALDEDEDGGESENGGTSEVESGDDDDDVDDDEDGPALSEQLVLGGPSHKWIKARSNGWLHDTWEKIFLTGMIGSHGTIMGLPREVTMGRILDFSGLKEDLAVATQLKSFGKALGHLSRRFSHHSWDEVWLSFKQCVQQELMQC